MSRIGKIRCFFNRPLVHLRLFNPLGGSTAGFFASSSNDVYQRVWNTMSGVSMADVMVASNTDGVEKVEDSDGKYAFFMESSSIEYLVERRCKLSQVKTKFKIEK